MFHWVLRQLSPEVFFSVIATVMLALGATLTTEVPSNVTELIVIVAFAEADHAAPIRKVRQQHVRIKHFFIFVPLHDRDGRPRILAREFPDSSACRSPNTSCASLRIAPRRSVLGARTEPIGPKHGPLT